MTRIPPMRITTTALALAASALLLGVRAEAACDCSTMPNLGEGLNYPAMSLFKDINISGAVWAENGVIGLGNDQNNDGKVSVSGSSTVSEHIYYHNGQGLAATAATSTDLGVRCSTGS